MSDAPDVRPRTEIRDGMRITWHQRIEMDDGIVLRADVYRPVEDGRYPVILSYGIYARQKMVADHPEILQGSTNSRRSSARPRSPGRWPRSSSSRHRRGTPTFS